MFDFEDSAPIHILIRHVFIHSWLLYCNLITACSSLRAAISLKSVKVCFHIAYLERYCCLFPQTLRNSSKSFYTMGENMHMVNVFSGLVSDKGWNNSCTKHRTPRKHKNNLDEAVAAADLVQYVVLCSALTDSVSRVSSSDSHTNWHILIINHVWSKASQKVQLDWICQDWI